jgi:CHAD domain-containing protein
VPEEVRGLLLGVARGEPLVPLARLEATRRGWQVQTSDGRPLAEVSLDDVTGATLASVTGPGAAGPAGRAASRGGPHLSLAASAPATSFSELEVELAEGSALEVLEAIVDRLVACGARRSSRKSKLLTVLETEARASAGLPAGDLQPAPTTRDGGRQAPAGTAGHLLAEEAAACVSCLMDHDIAVRLGDPDPEHVHRSRVAVRRLRSVLRALAPLWAGPVSPAAEVPGGGPGCNGDAVSRWANALRDELRWLGRAFGSARDADVRLLSLETDCEALGPVDADGARVLLETAIAQKRAAHRDLLAALSSARYVRALRALDALAAGPRPLPAGAPGSGGTPHGWAAAGRRQPAGSGGTAEEPLGAEIPPELWSHLSQPAASVLPRLADRYRRSLRRSVRRLPPAPDEPALHRIRIKAKRLRYLVEVATPALRPRRLRKAAGKSAQAAASLQDVLGQLHDAAVRETWLREVASADGAAPSAALAAGLLVAAARQSRRSCAKAWPAQWRLLNQKRLWRWTA